MRITITARHCEIPDELRARARERLERLARIAPRPHDGRVVFVADHGRPTVEVRLHTGRGAVHVGTARGADHRTALDLAVAKVRRQLDKDPTRRRPWTPPRGVAPSRRCCSSTCRASSSRRGRSRRPSSSTWRALRVWR